MTFNSISTDSYHNIFEYSSTGATNVIYFSQKTSDTDTRARLRSIVNGVDLDCEIANSVDIGTVHVFKFGVDATDTARIYQDRTLLVECVGFAPPPNVPRDHLLGGGNYDSNHQGAILGVRVTNLGVNEHPRERFKFVNMPGQTFADTFVASFYARWDSIASRSYQRAFDIGNLSPIFSLYIDNILCGQLSTTSTMRCEVWRNGDRYSVEAPNSIVQGVFAFWHFGLEVNGTMWISKDNNVVGSVVYALPSEPPSFRRNMKFGQSNNIILDDDLDGVVLGFRLDRRLVS